MQFKILTILFLFIMSSCNQWEKSRTYLIYSKIPDASGLSEGASVEFKGIKAGKVKKIALDENLAVVVQLAISKEFRIPFGSSVYMLQDEKRGMKLTIKATHAKKYYKEGDTLQSFLPEPELLELELINDMLDSLQQQLELRKNHINQKIDL